MYVFSNKDCGYGNVNFSSSSCGGVNVNRRRFSLQVFHEVAPPSSFDLLFVSFESWILADKIITIA